MAAPPLRRMDTFGAGPARLEYLVVPGGGLLPLGRPAVADRIRMGNRRASRRVPPDVWQRVAMDVERLPSICGLFRGSLQRVLEPLVSYPQNAAWRRLHDSFAHDAPRVSKFLQAGTIRHLGRIPHLRSRLVTLILLRRATDKNALGIL